VNGTGSAPEPWSDLLAAAQGGDGGAYRAFLKAIVPLVRALTKRRGVADSAIDDVVQDVLLTVHRVRHTYEPGRPVEPWLAAIVTRRAIDALRRSGRTGAREVHDAAALETYADPAANSEGADGDRRQVAQMMDDLTPAQREAVELVKLKEMSLLEASGVSGQSVAALKVNIHRAIKRMRRAVGTGNEE
jgi:RNA polymerase sigma-70 factor (ECF subfamily)